MIYKKSRSRVFILALGLAFYSHGQSAFGQSCFKNNNQPALGIEERKSVVLTIKDDLDVFDKANKFSFEFKDTIGAIISSALGKDVDTQAERISLVASMIRSFRLNEISDTDVNMPIKVTGRPGEARLDPIKMLDETDTKDGFKIVGLFNRFDLAPDNYSDCGEYRLVYEKNSGINSGRDRMTLIFEAKLDNPDPTNNKDGCKPVVKFWESLPSLSGEKRQKLFIIFTSRGFWPMDLNSIQLCHSRISDCHWGRFVGICSRITQNHFGSSESGV